MVNRCIILAGGSSIRENLWNIKVEELPIWKAIKSECLFTLNYCYSDDTEVFTQEGWKYFKNLKNNEKVLTRNYDGSTFFTKILERIEQNYKGKLINLFHKQIDLLITPNHQFYLLRKNEKRFGKKYKIVSANYFKSSNGSKYAIPQKFIWNGINESFFILPALQKNQKQKRFTGNWFISKKINMNTWCAFFGLFLAEGYTCKYKSQFRIGICQNITDIKTEYIENILNELPFHFFKRIKNNKHCQWICNNRQLYYYLSQFGKAKDKFIPREILNLDKKYLKHLLNAFIFGDGYINKYGTRYAFTVSKQLASDLQEIFYKLGCRARIVKKINKVSSKSFNRKKTLMYWIEEKQYGNHINLATLNIKDINYQGKIYCIRISEPHTIFVRRNGKCCWSGNSYKFIKPTIALINDFQAYVTEKEKLDKLPMVVSIDDAYYKRSQDPYRDEIRCELGKNLYLLKGANEYYGENSWKKGFYSKELVGLWAINFALRCGFKQIYLLGFDSCSINGHTHFYDDNPEIGKYQWNGQKHYGVGFDERGYYRTGVYNKKKELNEIWFKPFINERDKIINVSPNSAIDTFEKWNYEQFYQYLKENPIQINQEEIRQEIKELIKNKS